MQKSGFLMTRLKALLKYGFSHPYHLDESTLIILGASGVIFHFYFIFREKHVSKQKSPSGKQCFAASHLGIFCLPMSHKKDARLLWVKHVMNSADPQIHSEWRGHVKGRFLT